MKVRDVMRQSVVSLPQNANLNEILHRFKQHHIDCLPIVDAATRVVGLITIEDLIDVFLPRYFELLRDYAVLEDKGQMANLFDVSFSGLAHENLIIAADVMNSHVAWVSSEDSLLEAASRLQAQHFQRLPVIDRDQKLVGLISDFEIVLALLEGTVQVTAS